MSDRLDELSELERRRLELSEERDRALAALKELEFDHRTGKVSDEDYRQLVGPLRRRAAETLRALEPRAEARHEPVDMPQTPVPRCGAELPTARASAPSAALPRPGRPTVRAELPPEETGPSRRAPGTALLRGRTAAAASRRRRRTLVVALALFVSGQWPFALIALGLGALLLAAFFEVAGRRPSSPLTRATSDARDALARCSRRGGPRGATADARRIHNGLARVADERRAALLQLGEAAHRATESPRRTRVRTSTGSIGASRLREQLDRAWRTQGRGFVRRASR